MVYTVLKSQKENIGRADKILGHGLNQEPINGLLEADDDSIQSSLIAFQDFTLDIYFRQYWKDNRLSFQRQHGVEILSVSTEYLRNMWVPDTFFANEKTAYLHMVTTSNEFVRIAWDGKITRSMRFPSSHIVIVSFPTLKHFLPSAGSPSQPLAR